MTEPIDYKKNENECIINFYGKKIDELNSKLRQCEDNHKNFIIFIDKCIRKGGIAFVDKNDEKSKNILTSGKFTVLWNDEEDHLICFSKYFKTDTIIDMINGDLTYKFIGE